MSAWVVGAIVYALATSPDPPAQAASEPAQVGPAERPLSRRGEHWRLTWLLTTHGSLVGLGTWTLGVGAGGYLGAGVPVRRTPGLRQEHGFGLAYEISGVLDAGMQMRARVAATGLVGRDGALFYQGAVGWHGYDAGRGGPQGPSVGGKLGIAAGNRVNMIFALSGDVDFTASDRPGVAAFPVLSLTLLAVGSL